MEKGPLPPCKHVAFLEKKMKKMGAVGILIREKDGSVQELTAREAVAAAKTLEPERIDAGKGDNGSTYLIIYRKGADVAEGTTMTFG